MTGAEFAARCQNIARNVLTCYVWGGLGMPVTDKNLVEMVARYPAKNKRYCDLARPLLGEHAFMFDCVNLLKAVLWGWNGDFDAIYGGAVVGSNGVPDINADQMFNECKESSNKFGDVKVGEALWMPGHIGVYVGNGLGVEATPAWDDGVQITAVGNIGTKSGYHTRTWSKHGKLPYVSYSNERDIVENGEIIVNGKSYPIERVLEAGRNYFQIRPLVDILNANGTDIKVSNKGSIAVLEVE